jgi:sugar phosphate isomerase/epimerase
LEGYKRIEALSKKYGVKALFEMHMNNITPSASGAEKFARNFDPKYVGVIYDIGNMVSEGYEIYSWGLEILGEYLDYVHVKNAYKVRDGEYEDGSFKWKTDQSPFNEGVADFNALYEALRKIGYNDYIVTEDFSSKLDTFGKLKFNIGYLKNIEKNVK